MSFQRKLFLVGCFLIVDVLLLGGIFFVRDITFQNVLKNEVNALVELDLFKDKYENNIKSSGKYAVVERGIKGYLDDYSSLVQESFDNVYLCDDLISIENYTIDGPLFVDSFKFIEKTRDQFNDNIDLLIAKAEREEINNYMYTYLSDEDCISLYHKLLLDDKLIAELDDTKILLENRRIEVNSYFSAISNVLTFLNYNKEHYKIENNELIFDDNQLKIHYDELITKTKRI